MLPLFNDSVAFSSVSDKAKFFAESFSKNSNLHDSGIFLPASFPSRNNLKLHNLLIFNIVSGLLDQLYIF